MTKYQSDARREIGSEKTGPTKQKEMEATAAATEASLFIYLCFIWMLMCYQIPTKQYSYLLFRHTGNVLCTFGKNSRIHYRLTAKHSQLIFYGWIFIRFAQYIHIRIQFGWFLYAQVDVQCARHTHTYARKNIVHTCALTIVTWMTHQHQ